MKQIEAALHPIQLDAVRFWLDHAPGEFTNSYEIDPDLGHHAGVIAPFGRIPMFRKIADSQLAPAHCVHPGNQSRCATSISSVIARICLTSSSAAVCGSKRAA